MSYEIQEPKYEIPEYLQRREASYRISKEWLQLKLGIKERIDLIEYDADKGVIKIHVSGEDLDPIPEGGTKPAKLLDRAFITLKMN